MDLKDWKFTLGAAGLSRTLQAGVEARILASDNVMLSHVRIPPHTETTVHSHPEEQWGILLSGSCTRIQGGEERDAKAGDAWVTPGGVPHGIRTGPEGAVILDVFCPPRPAYRTAGSGFGNS